MACQIRRRDFVAAIGGIVATSALQPLGLRAQPARTPLIGYLSSGTAAGFEHFVAAFRRGLGEAGYVEGQTVLTEFRWAEGQNDRLPDLAADLVRRRVALIAATGGTHPALAAKAATSTIPIVFTGGLDPVKYGLVASLNRPGGNATGAINISVVLTAKRLELLRELVPTAGLIAVLTNPTTPDAEVQLGEIRAAARSFDQPIHLVNASSEQELDSAFANIVEHRVGALFVNADPFFTSRRGQVVALATRHAVPASYSFRDFPVSGGLMSYGANLLDVHRQAGVYAGRILKGAKPGDLPVVQPTKFDLVLNLNAARALDLRIPDKFLALADEVIE